MSRCLVVGGNGFLGSHLVDALVQAGHGVTAFDRFSTEPRYLARKEVIKFRGDFLNPHDLKRAVDGQQYVFHFLSLTTPMTSGVSPSHDVATNVCQSIELFDICASLGVKHLYFASSGGAIYGESDKPIRGIHLSGLGRCGRHGRCSSGLSRLGG